MQLSSAQLIEEAIKNKEGVLSNNGSLVVTTGKYTGRSPNDRYFVDTPDVHDKILWGKSNLSITEDKFEKIYKIFKSYISNKKLYVFNGYVGADYNINLKLMTELASQNLFANHMFFKSDVKPEYTVISCPNLKLDEGLNSEAAIIINITKKLILIAGTSYAGEIKKSVFTLLNYLYPERHVLPMHCGANQNGNVALFFGLSGTGKTTLSSDPDRYLIGDDEHGWSNKGIFNFENGCYAKCVKLDREKEPEIWNAIKNGALVENVIMKDGELDFNDISLTENTRAAYPINHLSKAVATGKAGHPKTILFLTADAFGVLPPISKLSAEQAQYHFISGYTSKLAGTERGIKDPKATFSTCFGAPFMPLSSKLYADMLVKRIQNHNTNVFLVNTGWIGGPFGIGKRILLPYTRRMVNEALQGNLNKTKHHAIFNLDYITEIEGIPKDILDPTWEDKEDYNKQAERLAKMFIKNFRDFPEAKSLTKYGPV